MKSGRVADRGEAIAQVLGALRKRPLDEFVGGAASGVTLSAAPGGRGVEGPRCVAF